jgi:hypothetical protein
LERNARITKNSRAIGKVDFGHSMGNPGIGQTKIVGRHFGVNLPAGHFGGEDGGMTDDWMGQNGRNLNLDGRKKVAFVDWPNLLEMGTKAMEPHFDADDFGHLLAIVSGGFVVGQLPFAFHFVGLIEIGPKANLKWNDGHDFGNKFLKMERNIWKILLTINGYIKLERNIHNLLFL